MDPTLLVAAAGLRSRLETLELIGNNIANVNTAGFKADREFYSLFLGLEAESTALGDFTRMPVVEGSRIDLGQGVLTPTGAPLDVALSGPGFLVVEGPQGLLYTRNGNFRRSREGRLETSDGFAVRGERGSITLPPGEVKIGEDGSVWVAGGQLDRLQVVEFAASVPLTKVGRSYFRSADGARATPSNRAAVRQGHLEAANVNPGEAAVRLVEVTRQFEMLTRAVALVGQDMNRRAVEELPRSGS
jgi:flagellar basal body rod protein FlgG